MSSAAAPRRVRLVVQGELGPAMAAGFTPLRVSHSSGTTALEGVVLDVDAVITRLGDLGLTLLALETDVVDPDPGSEVC